MFKRFILNVIGLAIVILVFGFSMFLDALFFGFLRWLYS